MFFRLFYGQFECFLDVQFAEEGIYDNGLFMLMVPVQTVGKSCADTKNICTKIEMTCWDSCVTGGDSCVRRLDSCMILGDSCVAWNFEDLIILF